MTNNTDTKKFSGHCQVCGRLQAVTAKGKLAKHGYTVEWGWFNGVCPGSDALPFEQSKELAVTIIANVYANIEALDAEAESLSAPAKPEADGSWMVWVHEYQGSSRSGAKYLWRHVAVSSFRKSDDGQRVWSVNVERSRPDYRGRTTDSHDVNYDAHGSESLAITSLNARRAYAIRRTATQQRQWIVWQEERCAAWTVLPLPVRK